MNKSILIIGLLTISFNSMADWSGPFKGNNFVQTFPAGHEADGKPLYIAQCAKNYATDNVAWNIGKAGVHLHNGMAYSWVGKEYDSSNCRNQEYYVYIADSNATYKWIVSNEKNTPKNAVKNNNTTSSEQFICRASFNGGQHPGKIFKNSTRCFIAFGGKEYGMDSYEILIKE